MASQKRRRRGLQRFYPDGRRVVAESHDRYVGQLAAHYGPMDALAADYAELVAFLRVSLAESMRRYASASSRREHGRGRRPALDQVNRLLKRVGLDFGSFDQALRRLEELSKRNGHHAGDDLAARLLALPPLSPDHEDARR